MLLFDDFFECAGAELPVICGPQALFANRGRPELQFIILHGNSII
jgi:hypothetical protein